MAEEYQLTLSSREVELLYGLLAGVVAVDGRRELAPLLDRVRELDKIAWALRTVRPPASE